MAEFKFKSKKKSKFNFISNNDEKDFFDVTHIEMFSNKNVIVEGCKKILDYQNDYIKLKLKKGTIIFWGLNFVILDFDEEKIIIKGKISSVEFCV